MEKLIPRIKEIAQRITFAEEGRKRLAEFLKSISPRLDLVKRIEPDSLRDIKVVGIDGGVVKKSLHGFDSVLVRAAGVCFHYKNAKISRVEYFPSKIPEIQADVLEALTDLDFAYYASIMRQSAEIRSALLCMEKFSPDVLLLDGSIVPHHSDRPSKSSPAFDSYKEMIQNYKILYKKSIEERILLAGVVEDSRGVSFCNLIKDDVISKIKHPLGEEASQLLSKTRDTNLLFWVLRKGEMSRIFRYSDSPNNHPVLRDFDSFEKDIYSFYLKTAEFDRPIRVDYLLRNSAERIAKILLAISGHHSGYGLPVPLIEADNVSKLSEAEIETFHSLILAYTGNLPSVMKLRREQRPF